MRVIVTGLPYFSKILQHDLRDYDSHNTYFFCNTYYSLLDKIKFAVLLPFTDLVISLNGVTDKSGSLELAVKLKKKIMMLWQGTDVLLATERYKNKSLYTKYLENSVHFTDSLTLIEELNEIGINAELLNFKYIEKKQLTDQSFQKISVYSYIAEGKEAFYGLDILLAVFEKYPHIDFKIIGCKGKSYPEFPNVKYYGWVDSNTYLEICNYTPVFIRLTEHDGYSKSVMEAISSGNEVIWNMKHEHCHYVKRDSNDVSVKLNEVIQIIEKRNLRKNLNNISWAEKNLNKENVLDDFIQTMQKVINSKK